MSSYVPTAASSDQGRAARSSRGELSLAGKSVIVVEEGGYHTSASFTQRESEMYPRLYRERGTRPTADHRVLVSQGQALGGSTLVSWCLCFDPPGDHLELWRDRFGCAIDATAVASWLDRVGNRIGARDATEIDLNSNNRILRDGSSALGYRGRFVRHNRTDCLGCGACALGCPFDRKGDALTTDLTEASRLGARILPEVRVRRILHEGGVVKGVEGRCRVGRKARVRVFAPVVILAAGALESPRLWVRSRLPNPHGLVGRDLRLNPSATVIGVFDQPVRAWRGMPHSWITDHFQAPAAAGGGFLLLAGEAQPVATAALLPGFGKEHRRLMERYESLAGVTFLLNEEAVGELSTDRRGQAVVDFSLGASDRAGVRRALREAAGILFAGGARSVVFPYNEKIEIQAPSEARLVEERPLLPNDPLFLSFQPQGTLRMGGREADSVCDSQGRARGTHGLWVADASLLPASPGVPIQMTIMAIATGVAAAIAGGLSGSSPEGHSRQDREAVGT